jgi:L-asparaginase
MTFSCFLKDYRMAIATHVLMLGTGGTIAGAASDALDNVNYQAAVFTVSDLLNSTGCLSLSIDAQQLCQVDSKDMGPAVWWKLLTSIQSALEDKRVAAIVVTHGTDTLEETAALLAWGLPHVSKPVVLTCAMRPATSKSPDGPQNLRDAFVVARNSNAIGISVVAAGKIHAAEHIHKVHSYRLDAFNSFEQGCIGCIEEGSVRWLPASSAWREQAHALRVSIDWSKFQDPLTWPRVEWLTSHSDSDADIVDALLAFSSKRKLRGLIVAGTGNGTLHEKLLPALRRAHDAGILVRRTTRCIGSMVVNIGGENLQYWPPVVNLSPSKARIALMLECIKYDADIAVNKEATDGGGF